MSNCASSVTCPGGNCPGCQNGQVWCQDPRCSPNCAGEQCMFPASHNFNSNMVFLLVFMCLTAIFFILWFVYGHTLFTPHDIREKVYSKAKK